jgi:predicted dithiol-disulfide oxidoreductase (DUF899 family)
VPDQKIVSHDEWLAARKALLVKEKEFTRMQDEIGQARRNMPWERVEKHYVFQGPDGPVSLADLFSGRSQLIVYHFMFNPEAAAGCPHCSLRADGFAGIATHLLHRDTSLVAVSRAPYAKLAAYKARMEWRFPWVSSQGSDFNYDFHASFTPQEMAQKKAFFNYEMQDPQASDREGHSIFIKDQSGAIFHTYSCYARGNELLNIHYHFLDMTPKGRDEGGRGPFWVRRHDEYGG